MDLSIGWWGAGPPGPLATPMCTTLKSTYTQRLLLLISLFCTCTLRHAHGDVYVVRTVRPGSPSGLDVLCCKSGWL